MPYQRSLTIVAPVRAGAEADVEALLATMGDGVANGSVLDFGALDERALRAPVRWRRSTATRGLAPRA